MVRIPKHGSPTHPGEMLLEEFLKPLGVTQRELAEKIEVSCQRAHPQQARHHPGDGRPS